MKIKDYIAQKFQSFGYSLSEAELLDISLSAKVSGEDEMNSESHIRVSVAIAKFIPSLLLRATSVSESGFSMSWDTKGIREYYSLLCRKYGIEDELNKKPKITFL